MQARSIVEVGRDASGRSVVRSLQCEAPLLVRQDGVGDEVVLLLVGGAAGPLGGDALELIVRIGAGASASVRSVAAMMVQPGVSGDRSSLHVEIDVEEAGSLDWCPQPTISVAGSDHRSVTRVRLAPTASLRCAETVLLGRHHEVGGRLASRQRLEIGGEVVLDHEIVMGPGGPSGPGAHGAVRWLQSEIVVGAAARATVEADVTPGRVSGVFPLRHGASLAVVAGDEPATLVV